MRLVDSHCHIDDEQFDSDREQVIARALDAGIERLVVIGTGDGPPDLEAGIRLADRHTPIYATAGVHPQYASRHTDELLRELESLVKHPKIVAVGEIGLDYHWEPYSPEQQKAVFLAHMELARAARKPIVIHTRDAWADTMQLLREHWAPTGLPCVMHCFTGGPSQAQEALDLGFYLSFAGVVTYPKATELHQSARMAPLDRMLIETDAPYLPPVPFRGKRNEPAYVAHTAAHIAALRGASPEEIGEAAVSNFYKVFGTIE